MVLQDKIVRIRKPHSCFGCYRRSEKGHEMRYETVVHEGDIYNLYYCQTCDTLLKEFDDLFRDDQENCYYEGCVTQIYHDYKVTNPEDLLFELRKQKQ